MAKAIHSCIRVLNPDHSIAFYEKAFGLSVKDHLDFEGFALIYMSNAESDFELELTVNKDRAAPYELGDGYGHFAVSVENLEEAHACMEKEGLEPGKIVEFAPGGTLLAKFFFISDPDGYKIEVIERGGRFL
ncbi:VOC family protein [Celeribacter neptunius]|uniref:Aldoketomutase n=1 Tax=Celeribacter neptunius TaxID=588602 RepID=A0A1I3JT84_9RHOB|nr:VOC family protein [Celeribacter neptunius]SFI63218.1 lactoylglutathione lyase [Celeribacter neptunius]